MIPVVPVVFLQYFDLITLSILVIVITILVRNHYKESGYVLGSISQTVAADKHSSTVFSITMTIFFPLYYAFIWFWVGPLVNAPQYFYYLLILSALCEITFVWVPATTGASRRIHEIMAGIVAVAMFLSVIILLRTGNLTTLATLAAVLFLITPFIMLVLLCFRRFRKYTFTLECWYGVTFLAAISTIAHS